MFKEMTNNYISAAAQPRSLEKPLKKDEGLKKSCQETIEVDLEKALFGKLISMNSKKQETNKSGIFHTIRLSILIYPRNFVGFVTLNSEVFR